MTVEIKNRSGIEIYEYEGESLSGANLRGANLSGADLSVANLNMAVRTMNALWTEGKSHENATPITTYAR